MIKAIETMGNRQKESIVGGFRTWASVLISNKHIELFLYYFRYPLNSSNFIIVYKKKVLMRMRYRGELKTEAKGGEANAQVSLYTKMFIVLCFFVIKMAFSVGVEFLCRILRHQLNSRCSIFYRTKASLAWKVILPRDYIISSNGNRLEMNKKWFGIKKPNDQVNLSDHFKKGKNSKIPGHFGRVLYSFRSTCAAHQWVIFG